MKSHLLRWISLLFLILLPLISSAADIICPRCGASVDPSMKFCGNCGAIIQPQGSDNPELQATPQRIELPPLGAIDPSVLQLIDKLSEEDLRRIVAILLERIEVRQERMETRQQKLLPDPNSVGSMSRYELEELLRKYSTEKPPPEPHSSFEGFLKFIGGTVLIILAISIIVSL